MNKCPWFVRTNLDQRIYCDETGEHTTHTYQNVFQVDRSEYVITLDREDQLIITRYAADGQPHHDDRGPWVLYAEHLVAIEALSAENAAETAQHVKPIYVDAWDGMAVPHDEHLVAVEAAHAAGMREALADFLTSIDDDDPVYQRGYVAALDAAREAASRYVSECYANTALPKAEGVRAAINALRGES